MKKKIKEVNGVKVIRRYSAGAIFSGLFCLLLVAIPVVLLFLPWFRVDSAPYPVAEGDVVTSINVTGLELIKTVFIGRLTNVGSPFMSFFSTLATDSAQGFVAMIGSYVCLFAPILYLCLLVFALFFLFFGLEYLFRGRMNHFKAAYLLSWPYFIVLAIFCAVGVALQFLGQYAYGKIATPTYTLSYLSWYNYIFAGAALLSLICLGIIYASAFKNKVFIGDVGALRHVNEKGEEAGETNNPSSSSQVVIDEENVIKKIRYVPAIGLPAHLKNIGGHAFAENQNLVIAIIPTGIREIGKAAFANCGHLKVVSLPLSLRSLGQNAFFNCQNIQRINYAGSKEQWRHISRGSNWLSQAGTCTVICVDGAIVVNPYH